MSSFFILILSISNEMRMKLSRYNFLVETEKEKEGYTKSVKSLLIDCEKTKELGKGMHGVLANIIDVPKEYQILLNHRQYLLLHLFFLLCCLIFFLLQKQKKMQKN